MTDGYLRELFSLAGRTALVTGGSSGIGLAIARGLAKAGAEVSLAARTEAALIEAAATIPGATWHRVDLADRAAIADLVSRVPDVDILVTAAGVNVRRPMNELSPADWDTTMAINLDAPFLLGQHYGPRMAERGWGRIVHLASQQSIRALGNSGAYGVSKAGISALARSQAEAWTRYGVTSNAIAPGYVSTPLTAPVFSDPVRVAQLAERTMAGRNGLVEDLVGLAVLLAGPSAGYLTGQTIFLDGGFSVH